MGLFRIGPPASRPGDEHSVRRFFHYLDATFITRLVANATGGHSVRAMVALTL